jgi:hypothetical protein
VTKRIRASDGSIVEFPDDATDAEISHAMRQMDQEQMARERAGANGPGGVAGMIAGQTGRGPRNTYEQTYQRRSRERAPQGRPGSLLRGLEDFNRGPLEFLPQMFRNMGVSDEAAGATEFLRSGGNPDAARAGADWERSQQRRMASEQPGVNAASIAASIPAFGGNPASLTRNIGMLEAGAGAAGINLPFAIARQEGDIQERLPGAAAETGVAFGLGAGAQGLANIAPRVFPRTRAQRMVDRMDNAGASVDAQGAPQTPRGVTPSLATANEGAGVSGFATKMVGDNIIGGVAVRPRVQRALTETRDAANDIRDAYGRARGTEGAGRVVQQGLTRFADDATVPNPNPNVHPSRVSTRDWSFAAKSGAVFDEALRPIANNPAPLTNTRSTVRAVLQRADDPAVRSFNNDPVLRNFVETLTEMRQGGRTPTLRDLRELRRRIREAQMRPRLGPEGVDNAALQRIEQALTEDIYAAAGQRAAQLRQADAFYRRGITRIEGVRRFFDPENPASSIRQILRAAAPRTENTGLLANLRSSLRDDEWRTVAASIIDEMGAPGSGASGFTAQNNFSVERFATAYRNMTPRARRIIFGSRGGQGGQSARTMAALADDLDNLAQVALAQKGVERSANFSGSGRDAQNFATFGLGLTNLPAGVGTVLALGLTGEMLTNPAFVRWLVSASRAGGSSGMRRQLRGLAQLASRDPALTPYYTELVQRVAGHSQPQPASADARSSQPLERTAPSR